jgi:hypothetical protein
MFVVLAELALSRAERGDGTGPVMTLVRKIHDPGTGRGRERSRRRRTASDCRGETPKNPKLQKLYEAARRLAAARHRRDQWAKAAAAVERLRRKGMGR